MSKRKNGEGTWGEKVINGIKYKFFRDVEGKYFYGKTEKEIKVKIQKNKEKKQKTKSDDSIGANTLFVDYVNDYIHNKIYIESSTLDGYEDVVNSMLKPYTIGNCEMQNINEDNMRLYLNELAEKYARSSIQKIVAVFRPALKYALEHEHIAKNPLDHVKIPSEERVAVKKKDIPYIIKSDLDKLYEESKRINKKGYNWGGIIGKPTYGINAQIIIFIGHTGLRISEVIGLRWKHIDIENKQIHVREALVTVKNRSEDSDGAKKYIKKRKGTKSKAGERDIPLSDIALEMIDIFHKENPNHKPDDPVVLTKLGTSPNRRNIQKTLDSMISRANCSIDHCGLHGLRHGFGAILLSQGVDIKIVSTLLGHEDITTTYNIYIDFTREQIENSVMSVLNK